MFDNLKGKAEGLLGKAKDAGLVEKADPMIDTVADKVDDMTHGKYSEHTDKAQDALHSAVDKLREDGPSER